MAVVAALTVQNTRGVSAVSEVAAEVVAQQLDAVLTDIPPDATKTGMLLTAGVVEAVAWTVKRYAVGNLVVDPVMISTSGARLMSPDAVTLLRRNLLPLAFIVTPNLGEAAALTGHTISAIKGMEEAARQIHDLGPKHVLIKGGHLVDAQAIDVLFDGNEFSYLRSSRIPTRNTHGTGCVLSAAIAAHLALGKPIREAVELGKEFVTKAIKNALHIGSGAGPCDPLSLSD
jgi:hydroxymethylpyrimidine/phosphomethylpyrimidine kinase